MALSLRKSSLFREVITAAGKFTAARLRSLGTLRTAPDWERRAAVCEGCHLRVIRCNVSYCGKPYIEQMERDIVQEGCGCNCRDKAKDPKEHCPMDKHHRESRQTSEGCTCKWCEGCA